MFQCLLTIAVKLINTNLSNFSFLGPKLMRRVNGWAILPWTITYYCYNSTIKMCISSASYLHQKKVLIGHWIMNMILFLWCCSLNSYQTALPAWIFKIMMLNLNQIKCKFVKISPKKWNLLVHLYIVSFVKIFY